VLSCVTSARENARQVREEISADMWGQVNRLFLRVRQMRAESAPRAHTLARVVIDGAHLFQGITDATMAHGEGWHYLQVGRFLERAGATAALLGRHLHGAPAEESRAETAEWVAVLRSCSAFEAYCRHYTADLRADRIAEFLLLDSHFPRSVRFAAAQVEQSLREVSAFASRGADRPVRLAGRLRASLDFGQVDEILEDDPLRYMKDIGQQCAQIHHAVHQTYMAYPIETAIPA
jgi:uncharacterized alpha-E superfamily protein